MKQRVPAVASEVSLDDKALGFGRISWEKLPHEVIIQFLYIFEHKQSFASVRLAGRAGFHDAPGKWADPVTFHSYRLFRL